MLELTTIDPLTDQAVRFEPNSEALDPLDALDQQWEQERITYVGEHNADPRIKLASIPMLGALLWMLLMFGAMAVREAINQVDLRFLLVSLVLVGLGVVLSFGLRAGIRLRLAEHRYLKQRAALAKALNRPSKPQQLTPKQRISAPTNPYASQWTAAEQQIYALQELHYAELKRDKHYHASIQRIIVDAPKTEQAYLTELVQLEQRWLNERLRYHTIKPYYSAHPERPDEDGAYPIRLELNSLLAFGAGLGLAGLGIWLAWKDSSALLNGMSFIAMGVVFITVAWELWRTKPNLQQAEQRYLQQQYALAQKYRRFNP
ncbi:hypothetical protein [Herpetosiphon geysericola]|uniref:Uncharacterized protein n=1 Tax=Herpetosiphon geysericola TaxID=70996 RepID=A0A0P6Y2R1_9CHLR|nr:hypothetical protein [Herpetosiphon geysericola]KPL90144.1 hypothetical protein SE18_08000 [Herpetosiphon geysericola]